MLLSLLLACGSSPAPHEHEHDEHPHHEEALAPAAADGIEAPLGKHTARLEPAADRLKLVVLDAEGKPVRAEGEARVVLTGTGEEEQRVVLKAEGEAWTGAARAAGAPGYVAVVNVEIGGAKESARLTWGTVPEAAPAPEPHGHDHGPDAGHEH